MSANIVLEPRRNISASRCGIIETTKRFLYLGGLFTRVKDRRGPMCIVYHSRTMAILTRSAIPHCSRIAMHLKAPLSRATRLKKGEEDESTPCRSRAARCKNKFAQVCILLFSFFALSRTVLFVRA